MRGAGFRIARVFGIPIYLHSSWFLVFALITLALASGFAAENQDWTTGQQWAVGLLASLLFFGSVLFHELSHSVVALHYRIPVKSITLFIFGGVAQIARDPARAWHEFLIAAAGPLSSGVLAGGFYLLQITSPMGSMRWEVGEWLSLVNFSLAIFNLVPGFPLDGGRILRAILWGVTGSYPKATRIASRTGEAVGFILIALGLGGALFGRQAGVGMFEGLWMAFIGWFLLNMARQSYAQVKTQDALAGLTVADVMTAEAPTVARDLSLEEYSQEVARSKSRTHLVVADGQLAGLMTIETLKAVPQSEWAMTSVQAVMLPRERVHWASPAETALSLMDRMRQEHLQEVAVVDNEHVVGLVTFDSVGQAMQIRSELKRGARA
jgi:Zn-dependent protease/predicted transcriptional regulator